MINKKYLKILIIVLITNLLIFVLNFPVSSQNSNSICSNLDRCVLLDGQKLFEIKQKVGDLTPEARAKKISEKLISKANDISINTDGFSVVPLEDNTVAAIRQNKTEKDYIVTINKNDSDKPLDLANQYNKDIQEAINNYRIKKYKSSFRGWPW